VTPKWLRFSTRGVISGDTSASGMPSARGSASARPSPKKLQPIAGASGSSQAKRMPRLLLEVTTRLAPKEPGWMFDEPVSNCAEPSGPVMIVIGDSDSQVPLPFPAIRSPVGKPVRPAADRVRGATEANVSVSTTLPHSEDPGRTPWGQRLSEIVSVPLTDRSRALSSAPALAGAGASAASTAGSRIQVGRSTGDPSIATHMPAAGMDLGAGYARPVPALAVREIPIADTRALRQAILRPHETLEELASHEPPDAFAVGAFDSDELVGVGFVGREGSPGSWRVRAMATAPTARGRGVGSAVLDALVEHAAANGATRVWCHARTPARSLYERAGFTVASDEFELPRIGPHFVMERNIAAPGC
jgi:ribosomal protein S18 acetylase RimI-like enzyme